MNAPNNLSTRRKALTAALTLAIGMGLANHATAGNDPELAVSSVQSQLLDLVESTVDESGDLQLTPAQNAVARQILNSTVGGTTRVVTNCNDSGSGSLRQTILQANSGDTIDMSSLTCALITLDSGITISQDSLVLQGDEGVPFIEGSSSNQTGLFRHTGSGTLTVSELILRNGTKYGTADDLKKYGGCIGSQGNVAIFDSSVKYCEVKNTGNNGKAWGGAVAAAGTVTLSHSLIKDNHASGGGSGTSTKGGGVHAGDYFLAFYSQIEGNTVSHGFAGGIAADNGANIKYSTIANNEADLIGGIVVRGTKNLNIENSTISGNTTTAFGCTGGLKIRTDGAVLLKSNTITENTNAHPYSAYGGGICIASDPANITMTSNIVGRNFVFTGTDTFVTDIGVTVPSSPVVINGSHNLIGVTGDGVTVPADSIRAYNPRLEPLDYYNGGSTKTHIPRKGSLAFNHGSSTASQDQNLNPRDVGAGVDIGSVETDSLFVDGFEELNRGGG